MNIGDKVIWRGSDPPEVGVVIHTCCEDNDPLSEDCYVAFFGTEFPSPFEEPTIKPYILRYYAASLELYQEDV